LSQQKFGNNVVILFQHRFCDQRVRKIQLLAKSFGFDAVYATDAIAHRRPQLLSGTAGHGKGHFLGMKYHPKHPEISAWIKDTIGI